MAFSAINFTPGNNLFLMFDKPRQRAIMVDSTEIQGGSHAFGLIRSFLYLFLCGQSAPLAADPDRSSVQQERGGPAGALLY